MTRSIRFDDETYRRLEVNPQSLADSGDYFFSLNRYLFVAEKPPR